MHKATCNVQRSSVEVFPLFAVISVKTLQTNPMKTSVNKILCITFSLTFLLVGSCGCGGLRQERVQNALDSSLKTLEKLDSADRVDLTEACFGIAEGASIVRIKKWVFADGKSLLSEAEREELLETKREIQLSQQALSEAEKVFEYTVKEINALIKTAKENGQAFNREEREVLNGFTRQIKVVNSSLRASIGSVYLSLKKLRNGYTAGNFNNLMQAHSAVREQIRLRKNCTDRLTQIATEISSLLSCKIEG